MTLLLHIFCPYHALPPSFGREQNSTKAEQVFAEVTKAIREYPVDFRGAQILTGNEEGSFGWITVNYLLETLIKVWDGERAEGREGLTVLGDPALMEHPQYFWAPGSGSPGVSPCLKVKQGNLEPHQPPQCLEEP